MICKINRCKKVIFLFYATHPEYKHMLEGPQLYQQAPTNRSQFHNICPVSAILAHVYFRRMYNKLN